MRTSISLTAAMASSLAVCSLHMRGRASLLKSLRKVETLLHSHIGTNAAASPSEALRRPESEEKPGYKSFYSVLAERQEQAERSVLISCPSKSKQRKIRQLLARHGDIKEMFCYDSYGMHTVVEFSNQESVGSLLEAASIPSGLHESMVPYKSRLLSLRNLGPADTAVAPSGHQCQPQTSIPINELIKRLSKEESMDQQISALTEAYQLTEENTRLRFLVCSLLKDIAAAYFPGCTIRPFGSSVNGFGKLGCDLDMFLDLDGISGRNVEMPKSGLYLEYQMKRASSERAVTQSILSVIAECVDQFGPGCVGVQKILSARCPLVRFAHQPSGFQCDLTANNRVAMKSSELLFLYAQVDPRVRQLVFAVRCWARAHGVTSNIPGAWITNFSLTIMVLFFLQGRSPPIIPTLDQLQDLAGPLDQSVIGGNNCTFVSDLSKIQLQSNTQTAEQLLREFFDFYATFPFSKKSINIRKGKEMSKPEIAPLHIHNPFETSLNVSKNVNATQLERFVALCQESSWLLQQTEPNSTRGSDGGNSNVAAWGLATLLLPSQVAGVKGRRKRRKEPASDRIKSLLESLKIKSQTKS